MIIELIEEKKYNADPMFAIMKDGWCIKWFSQQKDAEAFYNSVIADPSIIEPKRNILKRYI